jgi:hypothetical protein
MLLLRICDCNERSSSKGIRLARFELTDCAPGFAPITDEAHTGRGLFHLDRCIASHMAQDRLPFRLTKAKLGVEDVIMRTRCEGDGNWLLRVPCGEGCVSPGVMPTPGYDGHVHHGPVAWESLRHEGIII